MKKLFAGVITALTVVCGTVVPSFAATVDLPPEFSELTPILEIALKVIEFLAKIAHFLTGATR